MNIFTFEEFKKLENGKIFKTGVIEYDDGVYNWIARKDISGNWAIFWGSPVLSNDDIINTGLKIHSPEEINGLINPDSEMLKAYRH